jgi:hypothetical protein
VKQDQEILSKIEEMPDEECQTTTDGDKKRNHQSNRSTISEGTNTQPTPSEFSSTHSKLIEYEF